MWFLVSYKVSTGVAWLVDQVCSVMFLHFNNFLQCQHFKLDGSTVQILNITGMQKQSFEVRPDWSHFLVEGHMLMLECEECQYWLGWHSDGSIQENPG